MKIILTLTTIPSRLISNYSDDIMSCLNSLLNQSYSDYELHFNVPMKLKSTNVEYVIPEKILNLENEYKNFHIFRTEDYGPATKSIPTIERITDPNTIIIVVDDDLVYHEDLIVAHIENREKWPEFPVGYDGLRSKDNIFGDVRDHYFSSNYRNSRVDILQHYKSVSYKRSFFEDDFNDFMMNNLTWDDDLLMAAYFSMKKRDRICTFHVTDTEFKTLEEWREFGGVVSFPVLRHTQHDSNEGCNAFRQLPHKINPNYLYTTYIDRGYDPK